MVGAGPMSASPSGADIYHDASDFCRDLAIPVPATIKESVSTRHLTASHACDATLASSAPASPRAGAHKASKSVGSDVPSRSSRMEFAQFVEDQRAAAAARLATSDSVYYDFPESQSVRGLARG